MYIVRNVHHKVMKDLQKLKYAVSCTFNEVTQTYNMQPITRTIHDSVMYKYTRSVNITIIANITNLNTL
jgi:hypothetical protein